MHTLINSRADLDALSETARAEYMTLLQGSMWRFERDDENQCWNVIQDTSTIERFSFTAADFPGEAPAAPVYEPAVVPVVTSCSPLAFIERFTEAEQLAVVTAAMQVPRLRLWYDKLMAAQDVVFADPRLAAGLQALVQSGLITEARSAEILPLELRGAP